MSANWFRCDLCGEHHRDDHENVHMNAATTATASKTAYDFCSIACAHRFLQNVIDRYGPAQG